ncbi:MAG: hypothetical protein ACK5NK_08535 [Niabella sp.]
MLAGISSVLVIITVIYAWNKFAKKPDLENATGFGKILENKWYVDELYNAVIVKPIKSFSNFLSNVFDTKVVDGIVNGVGRLVKYCGRQFRWLQSGQTASYILMMVLSVLLVFIVQFFLRK